MNEFKNKYDNTNSLNKIIFTKNKKKKVFDNTFKNNIFETFFATGLTIGDLEQDENILVTALENAKIIHSREKGCGSRIHAKFSKEVYRFWCDCGALLVYPPRPDRDNALLVKWFPRKDNKTERT